MGKSSLPCAFIAALENMRNNFKGNFGLPVGAVVHSHAHSVCVHSKENVKKMSKEIKEKDGWRYWKRVERKVVSESWK